MAWYSVKFFYINHQDREIVPHTVSKSQLSQSYSKNKLTIANIPIHFYLFGLQKQYDPAEEGMKSSEVLK